MEKIRHPGSRQLAVSCDTSVEIRDLDTGKVVVELQPLAQPYHLAWHPDGKTLAVACTDSGIHLWDVAAGKQTLVLEGPRNNGITLAFNHAGDLLGIAGGVGHRVVPADRVPDEHVRAVLAGALVAVLFHWRGIRRSKPWDLPGR